jgi:hypothetical protein
MTEKTALLILRIHCLAGDYWRLPESNHAEPASLFFQLIGYATSKVLQGGGWDLYSDPISNTVEIARLYREETGREV